MTGKTHLAAGTAIGLTTGNLAAAAAVILGSVLPDIDSPRSLLGRYVPVLPRILPHRAATHSVLAVILASLVSPWMALGVMLHILLDAMNPKGVKLLWPVDWRVRFPLLHRVAPQDGVLDHMLGLCPPAGIAPDDWTSDQSEDVNNI